MIVEERRAGSGNALRREGDDSTRSAALVAAGVHAVHGLLSSKGVYTPAILLRRQPGKMRTLLQWRR
jgi:hypothetical protein